MPNSPTDEDLVWWQMIEPAYQSTGGIAWTVYCVVCGCAVIATQDDATALSIHQKYHLRKGERPDD